MKTWFCRFKNSPETLTVGDKFLLICEGDEAVNLKDNIHIKFLDKKDNYKLHILKTITKEPNFLVLEVSSYRPNNFQGSFIVTDGEESFMVENFVLSVNSILKDTKKEIKAQGPFGPFKHPFPLWYVSILGLIFFFLIIFSFILSRRFIKRRNFLNQVLKRRNHLNPSKAFILSLRKNEKISGDRIQILEKLFKIFLEDLFLIPSSNKMNHQIMNSLKKYQYQIYKTKGDNIRQILNEFESFKKTSVDQKTLLKLERSCRQTVFLLDQKKRGN